MIKAVKSYSSYEPYIIWELTQKCNFKCEYCTLHKTDATIHKQQVFKGIDLITKSKHKPIIDFTGGEPTLHPDYFEILKYALKRSESPVYTTTNASLNSRYLIDGLEEMNMTNQELSKAGFYLTYHHKQTDLFDYFQFAEILWSFGCKVFIKFLCDPDDFEGIKKAHYQLGNIKYDKWFMKYRWFSRDSYSQEYMDWIFENSKHNDIWFQLCFHDKSCEDHYYDSLVYNGLNNFKGMSCKALRLLYIDVIGRIWPSCFKEVLKRPIANLYNITDIDIIYKNIDKKYRCVKTECTEVINNRDKG